MGGTCQLACDFEGISDARRGVSVNPTRVLIRAIGGGLGVLVWAFVWVGVRGGGGAPQPGPPSRPPGHPPRARPAAEQCRRSRSSAGEAMARPRRRAPAGWQARGAAAAGDRRRGCPGNEGRRSARGASARGLPMEGVKAQLAVGSLRRSRRRALVPPRLQRMGRRRMRSGRRRQLMTPRRRSARASTRSCARWRRPRAEDFRKGLSLAESSAEDPERRARAGARER